jgi:heptose-I-phosphate ethanolaminephosphotransferase
MINGELLRERKWAFMLIALVLLFNPFFLAWSTDMSGGGKLLSWTVCVATALALAALDLFFRKRMEKIFLTVLYVLSLVPNLIVWSYLCISGLYMKGEMFMVIFNSNAAESKEYVHQFLTWQILAACVVYVAAGIFLLVKAHSTRAVRVGRCPLVFALAVLAVLPAVSLRCLSGAIPTFEFYRSFLFFKAESRAFEKERAERARRKMDVQCRLADAERHVFIVLLGESTTPCHMDLYGYFRETTPRMTARRDELHVYTDAVTPDTHTYGVLQKALTFASHAHPDDFRTKPSVVELFNLAGFETYWIANNPLPDRGGTSYGAIAREARHVYDVGAARMPDEIVMPCLDEILNDSVTRNRIIFIHLMGSHHTYESRYPEAFAHFDHRRDGDLPDLGFRSEQMKTVIDRYDNSVRYGDYVFDRILNALSGLDMPAWLLFFSDHGEEVFDTRNSSGHHLSNVYPCQSRVPFILWMSDKYRHENRQIRIDTARPYSIEHVIHSISTLSALEYEGYDPSLSIFSDEYAAPARRMVGREDYEDILKKTGEGTVRRSSHSKPESITGKSLSPFPKP